MRSDRPLRVCANPCRNSGLYHLNPKAVLTCAFLGTTAAGAAGAAAAAEFETECCAQCPVPRLMATNNICGRFINLL